MSKVKYKEQPAAETKAVSKKILKYLQKKEKRTRNKIIKVNNKSYIN